jgi:hypothetical protein
LLQYEAAETEYVLKLTRSTQQVFAKTIPAAGSLKQLFAGMRDRAELLELVSQASKNPEELRGVLAGMLIGQEVAEYLRSSQESTVDLRLELSPNQAKLPWEWIIGDHSLNLTSVLRYVYRCNALDSLDNEIIKWLQVALKVLTDQDVRVDGFLGPVAQKQLKQLGLPPVHSLTEIPEQLAPQ